MSSQPSCALDHSRAHLALLALYLSKAETRDKICRAIQYGAKCVSGGEPGAASNVDKTTSLARKVFRLLKSLTELQNLLAPAPKDTPLPLVLLGRARSALLVSFFSLDHVVWLGRTGVYQNKENTDMASKLSLYCFTAFSATSSIIEVCELSRLSVKLDKISRDLRQRVRSGVTAEEEAELKANRSAALQKARARQLSLIKGFLDIGVGVGLLQLAPQSITPRVTGGLGFITSLISLYQLLPSTPKSKAA